MHRWRNIAVIMLVAGIAAPVWGQASKGDAPARSSSWWPGWLSFGKKADKKAPEPPEAPVRPLPLPRLDPAVSAMREKGEKDDLLRRVKVCDRLRLIAEETGDGDLARKADHLEQRAWEYYRQRIDQGTGFGFEADARVIDRHLAPAGGMASGGLGAALPLGQGRAAVREKQP
jgi:hypothetical protein